MGSKGEKLQEAVSGFDTTLTQIEGQQEEEYFFVIRTRFCRAHKNGGLQQI
jgi:hypothetical protein